MGTLKITQLNKWFVVEHGEDKITMLNQRSLVYHLKRMGFDSAARASIVNILSYENSVTINLEHTSLAS